MGGSQCSQAEVPYTPIWSLAGSQGKGSVTTGANIVAMQAAQ
jgi:hypothetical protein